MTDTQKTLEDMAATTALVRRKGQVHSIHHKWLRHSLELAREAFEAFPDAATEHSKPVGPPPRGCCVSCYEVHSRIAMVPCGHLCLCSACSELLPNESSCPICRAPVTQRIKIHDSGAPASTPAPEEPVVVWYTPVTIAGREYLRDSKGRVFDIENPERVCGRWGRDDYLCEKACGFVGSFESCLRHEQDCDHAGGSGTSGLTSALVASI